MADRVCRRGMSPPLLREDASPTPPAIGEMRGGWDFVHRFARHFIQIVDTVQHLVQM